MRREEARERLQQYLDNLKDAGPFLGGPKNRDGRYVSWLYGLTPRVRKRILDKLEEVDPAGRRKVIAFRASQTRRMKRSKKVKPKSVDVTDSTVAIRKGMDEVVGVSKIRFMDIGGLRSILAICLAAGYTREETAAMAGMSILDFNQIKVGKKDVELALRRMPEAIRLAADQIVMRDLLKGEVTDTTEKADRIVDRRTKHVLTAHKEKREDLRDARAQKELDEMRRQHAESRFGVSIPDESRDEGGEGEGEGEEE